jgi:hypothetical protein
MRFWEENKKLVIGVGIALLVLLVLFPSLFGFGPVVWGWQRANYTMTVNQSETLERDLAGLYVAGGKPTSDVIAAVEAHNRRLSEETDALKRAMMMVTPKPFRIPPFKTMKGVEAQIILSQARTNRLRYASVRGVDIGEGANYIGFRDAIEKGQPLPENEEIISQWLLQLAAVDELVKAAVDARVMQIEAIDLLEPFKRGAIVAKPLPEGADPKTPPDYEFYPHLVRYFPIHLKLYCSLESLMTLAHSLEGLHGKVLNYSRQADAKGVEQNTVELDLGKQHGLELATGDIDAVDRFTIFGSDASRPDGWIYKARTSRLISLDDTKSAWAVPSESFPELEPDEQPRAQIKPGDIASSRFYSVLDMKIISHEPEEAKGGGTGPIQVKPFRLEVDMWVAATVFLKVQQGVIGPPDKGGPRPGKTPVKPANIDAKHLGF